jgi:hypothetical protein
MLRSPATFEVVFGPLQVPCFPAGWVQKWVHRAKKQRTYIAASPLIPIGSGGRIRTYDLWVMSVALGISLTRWYRCNYGSRRSLRPTGSDAHMTHEAHEVQIVRYSLRYT